MLISVRKNKILRIVSTFTACIIFTSACSVTPKLTPVEKDDRQVTLIVDEKYIQKNSSYDYYPGQFFPNPGHIGLQGSGAAGFFIVAFIGFVEVGLFAVYTPLKLIGNSVQGIYITIQPDGYDEQYSQEVAYGKNMVWLPNSFLQNGGQLSITVLGERQGMWTENYDPTEKLEGITIIEPGKFQTSYGGE